VIRRVLVLALAAAMLPAAAGAQLDLRLERLGRAGEDGEHPGFGALAGDLAEVIGPKMLGPAATTGALGFDIGLDVAVTNVDEDSGHWQAVLDEPRPVLTSMQLQLGKGLPYSFELGGTITHVLDSDLWGVGMHLRYAFVEGYRLVPDVALRASVSTALGTRDMTLLVVGADLVVSKSFGVAGVLALSPYAGYSLAYGRASSYVLGELGDSQKPAKFVIPEQQVLRHRGVLGFRATAYHAQVAFEVLISDGIQTFTTKVGADF